MDRLGAWRRLASSRRARFLAVALLLLAVALAGITISARGGRSSASLRDSSVSKEGIAMPTTAAARAPASQNSGVGGASSQPAANISVPDPNRQIIKSGTLSLVVQDVASALAQARSITTAHGGLVTQSSTSTVAERGVADVTIQVPADQFESAMDALRGINGVRDRTVDKITSQDVTEEYVDVNAQVDNLKVTERQLQALMDKATRMEDVLAIQRELTTVRGQIDRLQGRLNYLQRRTAMSTISLHLEPLASTVPHAGWRFSEALSQAWQRSMTVLRVVADVALTVAMFALWLVPALGIVWFIWRLATRRPGLPPAGDTRPGQA